MTVEDRRQKKRQQNLTIDNDIDPSHLANFVSENVEEEETGAMH